MNKLTRGLKRALVALALLLAALGQTAPAQTVDQSRLEAAMTLRLLTFTSWPDKEGETATAPIRIGVFEAPEMLAALNALLSDEAFSGRFEAKAVTLDLPIDEQSGLDALFIGATTPRDTARMIIRFQGQPTVIIGAADGFLEMGGMVNLTKKQKRLGFEVDLTQSRKCGITYRAKLLRLATRIIGE